MLTTEQDFELAKLRADAQTWPKEELIKILLMQVQNGMIEKNILLDSIEYLHKVIFAYEVEIFKLRHPLKYFWHKYVVKTWDKLEK